jgi:CubicO group peptidase (beta-lactamase class C family)
MPDWTSRLTELATDAAVPGAVLGIWADGEQTITPYGVLNRATGVEVTADSLFQLGSITKPWTATMIVQLAAEDRLSLDDPVVKLLPGASIDERITVRQLLTHTSGIDGDVFTDTGRGDDCVERYVGLLAEVDQLFAPGAAYSYCNAGFVLLGRIIEVLDGRTWDESLRARLVSPLRLRSTVTLPEEAILHRAALGHLADGSPVTTWQLPRSIGPAGLVTASAADLLAFARLHLDDDTYAGMREPQVPFPGGAGGVTDLGLAWRLYDWSGRRLFGHDGTTISQLAFLRIDPEARLAVCLLTNSANGPALFDEIASEVFTHYVGVAAPPAPEPITTDPITTDPITTDPITTDPITTEPIAAAPIATDPIAADLSADISAESSGGNPVDLSGEQHVGVYERASVRMEVLRRDNRLLLTYQATGDRLAFAEEPVLEYELHPTAPADGNHYVTRSTPAQPWTPVTFTPTYLFNSGRVTPRTA